MRYIQNPPNPYHKYSAEFIGEPPATRLEVFEEVATKSVITKSEMPDMGVRYTVNCYRGCIHACTYCFARRYHEFLGYGAGTDFETKIVAKINAPQVLRENLKRTKEKINHLEFSFTTDPYLPLEASYELTRKCLIVCREFRMPVAVITKSPLITRDLDVLTELKATVFFSIPFPTVEKSKPFEPYVPVPEARFRAMETLAKAGVEVGIGVAPVIPTYNDADIPVLLEKARAAGATRAFMNLVHFDSDSVEDYFVLKLREKLPTKADRIINALKRERGGQLRHRTYADRSGKTEQWQMAVRLFDLHFKRLGFTKFRQIEKPEEKSAPPVQQNLFR